MNYTHLALVGERPPRSQCGASGRLVMRLADVDCPDCLQLEADRKARAAEPEPLMTTDEVASAFRVSRPVPARWAKSGLITCVRTPGGSSRFIRAEIEGLLRQGNSTPPFLKAAK